MQARLPADLVRAVDHLAVDWGVYRAHALERLLRAALALEERQVQDTAWNLAYGIGALAGSADITHRIEAQFALSRSIPQTAYERQSDEQVAELLDKER